MDEHDASAPDDGTTPALDDWPDSDDLPEAVPASPASPKGWWQRVPLWAWILSGLLIVSVTTASLVLTLVRLPYYTIAPGDALDVNMLVTVEGEPAEAPGEVLLLFVRQHARIDGWRYLQARLDSDIDLFDEEEISGGLPPSDVTTIAEADMLVSQASAKKVALEKLGYEVPFADDGVAVIAVFEDRPADGVLEVDDVILEANGTPTLTPSDLIAEVQSVTAGEDVDLVVLRGGQEQAITVGTGASEGGVAQMGILTLRRYDYPIDIEINTGSIGGPSAGLAMTISVLDSITPSNLTGGMAIAVTGEIDSDGNVIRVGGVGQKVVSARANGADLMLVPIDEVEEAQARANDLPVVGVADIDDALEALEAFGGDPLDESVDEVLAA